MTSALVNTCTRPVELHLAAGVVVVPPLSTIDCTAEDLALGQVQALFRSGVLALRPAAEPAGAAPEPATEPEPAAEQATAGPATAADASDAADPSESTVEHPAGKRPSNHTAQS